MSVSAGGIAEASAATRVEPPAGVSFQSPRLQIVISPTVERGLLDAVLGQVDSGPDGAVHPESTASDLMAAVGLTQVPGTSPDQRAALEGRIQVSISSLVSAQRDDGGWAWNWHGDRSDRYASARALWALRLARQAGHTVPDACYDKALGFVKGQVAATDNADLESKAVLLHALAAAGEGDFPLANRLYRDRQTLTTAALLHLALASAEMDRREVAGELLKLVAERKPDEAGPTRSPANSQLAWGRSPIELRAIQALALQAVNPKSPQLKELVDWLIGHRSGQRWAPDKATGPAALAICRWAAATRVQGKPSRLVITVNKTALPAVELNDTQATQRIEVPAAALVPGAQDVRWELTGQARFSYQAILTGVVPAAAVRSTTTDWTVERTYEPAPLERDGHEVPRGFDIVPAKSERFRNPLTQLPAARRGQVELTLKRRAETTPDQELEYLVVTEPIPSGTTVIESSLRGEFDSYAIDAGAITFYVGNRRQPGKINYELWGDSPGQYLVPPTVVRNAYRPQDLAVASAKTLTVLPAGQASADPYRLTPRELFELGRRAYERREWKQAGEHLSELVSKWTVEPKAYQQAIPMLLDVHLELGQAKQVVQAVEIIREKWPRQEIPFAKILKIGAAYDTLGEFERSYLVFRATVESVFTLESGTAGFLNDRGLFDRSVAVMGRLVGEYPPEPYVAEAHYALAQQLARKVAETGGPPGSADAESGRAARIAGRPRLADVRDRPDAVSRRSGRRPGGLLGGPRAARTEAARPGRGRLRTLRPAVSAERPGGQLLVHHRLLPLRERPA